MITAFFDFVRKLLSVALAFLPTSPFKAFISQVESAPFLGYLNYFVPVGTFVNITVAWTSAIALYYIVSMALRWAKAIE